jgi:hypothetical protein
MEIPVGKNGDLIGIHPMTAISTMFHKNHPVTGRGIQIDEDFWDGLTTRVPNCEYIDS